MSKTQKDQTITINDKEYNVEDLTEEQVALVNHSQDLTRKIHSAEFNLAQLRFGYDAFVAKLVESLETEDDDQS